MLTALAAMAASALVGANLAVVGPTKAAEAPVVAASQPPVGATSQATLPALLEQFHQATGAKLVFRRADLPPAEWFDRLPPLDAERRQEAAWILLREAKKYPPGYFGAIGLEVVGVFAACVSRESDGYRVYDAELGGYPYFGMWNDENAIAAAYYSDSQLPLTFHHEVFHHVDATVAGETRMPEHFVSDDEAFVAAVALEQPRHGAVLRPAELQELATLASGQRLEDAVGEYAKKNVGEDQAETARHFMMTLPESLIQAALRPDLPGSQRILHVLGTYREAAPDGPTAKWFVEAALGRRPAAASPPEARPNHFLEVLDREIEDPELARRIRAAQPATTRVGEGSGVNLAADGLVLTAAHVVASPDAEATVTFPDGRVFRGKTVRWNEKLDLALLQLNGVSDLPVAPLAARRPKNGARVVVIGQPGETDPWGDPTGYTAFNVSLGSIRGFLPRPLAKQTPGRTKHDAWTYWGHSGSPLLNARGAIVAIHNSWDPDTYMRHAVPWEAIRHFLKPVAERVRFE